MDKNNNGWVSAEEVFPYVEREVDNYVYNKWPPHHQHPQLYDGYDGDLDITSLYQKIVKWKKEYQTR